MLRIRGLRPPRWAKSVMKITIQSGSRPPSSVTLRPACRITPTAGEAPGRAALNSRKDQTDEAAWRPARLLSGRLFGSREPSELADCLFGGSRLNGGLLRARLLRSQTP